MGHVFINRETDGLFFLLETNKFPIQLLEITQPPHSPFQQA